MQTHFDDNCPFFNDNGFALLLLGRVGVRGGGLKWKVPSSKGNYALLLGR